MPPLVPERIATERLELRRPSWSDLPAYVRMYADPDVMATLGGVRSAEEAESRLGQLIEHWNEHGYGFYSAFDRPGGRFAGRGGLRRVTIAGRDEVEVGYGLLARCWGRGLATELARRAVRLGFEDLGLDALVCFTLPTNRASRRVMEKVGFVYEEDTTYADLPHVLYRLTVDRWRDADPTTGARASVS